MTSGAHTLLQNVLDIISVCATEFSSSPYHDEIILSLASKCKENLFIISLLYTEAYIKENSRNACCSTSLFSK